MLDSLEIHACTFFLNRVHPSNQIETSTPRAWGKFFQTAYWFSPLPCLSQIKCINCRDLITRLGPIWFSYFRKKKNAVKVFKYKRLQSHIKVALINFVVVFQESVVKTLGNKMDNDTLKTFTLAEQLSTNLTDLNLRVEGTKQVYSSENDSSVL